MLHGKPPQNVVAKNNSHSLASYSAGWQFRPGYLDLLAAGFAALPILVGLCPISGANLALVCTASPPPVGQPFVERRMQRSQESKQKCAKSLAH